MQPGAPPFEILTGHVARASALGTGASQLDGRTC